jgi:hypothetical protein
VSECDREGSVKRPWPIRGCCAMGKNNKGNRDKKDTKRATAPDVLRPTDISELH